MAVGVSCSDEDLMEDTSPMPVTIEGIKSTTSNGPGGNGPTAKYDPDNSCTSGPGC